GAGRTPTKIARGFPVFLGRGRALHSLIPGEFVAYYFGVRLGIDDGDHARAEARFLLLGEVADLDAVAGAGFFYCGFGEFCGSQETANVFGCERGVERRRGLWLVANRRGVGVERGAGRQT